MQRGLADGLVVGLLTMAVSGAVSTLFPDNPNAIVISSGLGAGASSTILAKRRNRFTAKSTQQLSDAQSSIDHPQLKQSVVQANWSLNPIKSIATDHKSLTKKNLVTQESLLNKKNADSTSSESQGNQIINNWLSGHQIKLEDCRQSDSHTDDIFNRHAIFLGNNLQDENSAPLLAPLLKQFKWAISNSRNVQFHLKNSSQRQIQTMTRFCRNLYDDTLLSSYRYSNKIIHAVVQDRGDVRKFLTGEWFERFVHYKISERLQTLDLSYSHLMNPTIRFPNGDSFELDLLYLIEGQPLLVECKAGKDFKSHLKKFSDHRKNLSLLPERTFFVILDLEQSQSDKLSHFWKFKVINQDKLDSSIDDLLS